MLGVETEQGAATLNQSQLRSLLLRNVPMLGKTEPVAAKNESVESVKPKAKKVEKERAAPKPRAVPEDDTRCCSRTVDEKLHLEGGKIKVMRDDVENLYGDRCKFKKVGETEFCKHHCEKQPLGVWGGEYAGKLKQMVEKLSTEKSETPAKKTIKKAAPAAPVKVNIDEIQVGDEIEPEDAEEADEEEVDPEEEVQDEDLLDKLEAAGIQYEWIEIDDESYMYDPSTKFVYDPEDEKKIGTYDLKAHKWLSGGIPA